MDAEFSTDIATKEEAVELYEKYFRTLDESVFAPMIRGMMTHEFDGVFAIEALIGCIICAITMYISAHGFTQMLAF